MSVQWPLLIFSILIGISSGIAIFVGIGEMRGRFAQVRLPLGIIALILLAVGGCAAVFHLGHPERALNILGNPTSGLSYELFAVGAMGLVLLAYIVAEARKRASVAKGVAIAAAVLGVILPLVAGASYMMAARPAWDSIALPCMYLGTGVGMGFALSGALVCSKGDNEDVRLVSRLVIIGAAIMVATMLVFVIWVAMAPHQAESRSISRILSGDLAIPFWLGVVVIGAIGSLALAFMAKRRIEAGSSDDSSVAATVTSNAVMLFWAVLACALVGSIVLRVVMYALGTSVEQFIYL